MQQPNKKLISKCNKKFANNAEFWNTVKLLLSNKDFLTKNDNDIKIKNESVKLLKFKVK